MMRKAIGEIAINVIKVRLLYAQGVMKNDIIPSLEPEEFNKSGKGNTRINNKEEIYSVRNQIYQVSTQRVRAQV